MTGKSCPCFTEYVLYVESDVESSTSKPLHIGLIEEGKSDIESTRRTLRRRPLYEGDDEPTYPLVKENKESQRRDPTANIDLDIGKLFILYHLSII